MHVKVVGTSSPPQVLPGLLAKKAKCKGVQSGSLLFSGFDKQCLERPCETALIFNDEMLTYRELQQKVNYLACHLQHMEVQTNTLVAILLPKSDYQVVATLGILKAGNAYMPINMGESPERQRALLKKGQVRVVLTLSDTVERHDWLRDYEVVAIDDFLTGAPAYGQALPLTQHVQPSDLAYVVFTSGSTGAPKGVMISHANAVNTIDDINRRIALNEQDRVLALSALDFDLSVYDIFGPLSAGAAVVMPTEDQCIEPENWVRLIKKYRISIWDTVPGFMEMCVRFIQLQNRETQAIHAIDSLRITMLSGDWIRVDSPNDIWECFPNTKVIGLGGATEASIWSIAYPIDKVDPHWKSIPYGKPLKGQFFYILDEYQHEVAKGDEGELYIGGQGVGKGYWQDSENTQRHFIQHPTLGYLYRTGDKGRYMEDGNIEFLGRVGEQIKLRGFRLDTKAIESSIEELPEVKRCLVKIINARDASESLVAFVECDNFIDYIPSHFQVYKKLVYRHLGYWQSIYDGLFENSSEVDDPTFNTTGWVSSYSRKCIPGYQMQEWLTNAIDRISALHPKRILEVGAGTGMLLSRLASQCETYDATDTSANVIEYLKHHFSGEEYARVNCLHGELGSLPLKNTYDTVILNSVAQYFPDILYLIKTLDQLVDKVEPGGQLFLGDIYHYDYLEDFHVSVQLQHQAPTMRMPEFQSLISRLMGKEGELYIHPQLFVDYARRCKRVNTVDIQLKPGQSHNELNGFRYDVVLGIEKPLTKAEEVLVQPFSECSTIDEMKSLLANQRPAALVVKNIPNLRIIGLSSYIEYKEKAHRKIKSLREAVYQHSCEAIDPYDCYELGKAAGYRVSCAWSNKKYAFDVAFYLNENPMLQKCPEVNSSESYYFNYTNMPLLRQFQSKVEADIQQQVSQQLATYMQPHEIIFLEDIPFTVNGKVNHKALNQIVLSMSESPDNKPMKPVGMLEKTLIAIYKKVLKLHYIDLDKGFIQLGGDSLMMLEATYGIEKELGVSITLGDLIAHPSVRDLAEFLLAKEKHPEEMSVVLASD